MSSSLQLNQINIPQLNQCYNGKKLRIHYPPRPPPPLPPPSPLNLRQSSKPPPLPLRVRPKVPPPPPPPSMSALPDRLAQHQHPPTARTEREDIDTTNRVKKKQNDNNTTCSHHRYHTRGEQFSNDSEWSCGTATKDSTVYTPMPFPLARCCGRHGGHTIVSNCSCSGINQKNNNNNSTRTSKGICCIVDESVQCASALGDNDNNYDDDDDDVDDGDGNQHNDNSGTTVTVRVDSNFKCVSTPNGRVTCAVLPQPRPTECVHKRCHRTKRLATAASSIQAQEEAPLKTAVQVPQPEEQAESILPTTTSIVIITTTSPSRSSSSTNTTSAITTTSWASTSSVSSPPSVQDFAKCLTAEKNLTPPQRPENSLTKGPLSANSCDFILSELYFSPFGNVFCYNFIPCPAIGADSLQNLLNDRLGNFCPPDKIFLVANQSSHSQWQLSTTVGLNQLTAGAPPSPSVQKFNYFILSACNLNSVLQFVNNELVSNLNEHLYFLPIASPLSSLSQSPFSCSSSSSTLSRPVPLPSSAQSSSLSPPSPSSVRAVTSENHFRKSSHQDDDGRQYHYCGDINNESDICSSICEKEKVCDVPRRRTSSFSSPPCSGTTTQSPPTDQKQHQHYALDDASCIPSKAPFHSLLKVSDAEKNSRDIKKNNRNSTSTSNSNGNNDNERQCNGSSGGSLSTTVTSTVTDKNIISHHLVEDDAFRASQRLKRLEENFKDLTVVRKVAKRQASPTQNTNLVSVANDIVSENREHFENTSNQLSNVTESTRLEQESILISSKALAIQHKRKNQINNQNVEQKQVDKNQNEDVNVRKPCICDSDKLSSPSTKETEKGKSLITNTATETLTNQANEIIIKSNESPSKGSIATKYCSAISNNSNSTPKTDSSCPQSIKHSNETHSFNSPSPHSTFSPSFVNNRRDSLVLKSKPKPNPKPIPNAVSKSNLNADPSAKKIKEYFYINRSVPSISEFDVRQLSDLHLCCNKNNSYCNGIVAYECYDELLDEEYEQSDSEPNDHNDNEYVDHDQANVVGYTSPGDDEYDHQQNKNNEENVQIVCNCQKCFLKRVVNPHAIVPVANHCYQPSSSVRTYRGHFTAPTTTTKQTDTSTYDYRQLTLAGDYEFEMREINGQLRGLLKKPNRPPPTRKNRVVFDETRNEFFEADYIILIREDCAYDEEDEEPCTCGEHELVRLCCEEGCQCNYTTDETRTPQSPKFAPPIEFVDEAALSPPDGYKDNGLKNTLGGALSGHIFGAQHIQQLQVIQRLQQQRAAMLAARNNNQTTQPTVPPMAVSATGTTGQQPSGPPTGPSTAPGSAAAQPHSPDEDAQPVCTECAECVECAAKQLQDAECTSPQYQEEVAQLSVPTVALLPLHSSSPERRITQKEIIAGEERPKYLLQSQYKAASVTERRIVRESTEDIATAPTAPVILQQAPVVSSSINSADATGNVTTTPATPAATAIAAAVAATAATVSGTVSSAVTGGGGGGGLGMSSCGGGVVGSVCINESAELIQEVKPPIPPKESSPTQISGILKGGKLWKQESISQSDDMNTSSEDDTNAKRSVRFVTEDSLTTSRDGDGQAAPDSPEHDSQINELIPIKKHSTLFTNALRPNSAVRQLFPSAVHQSSSSSMLTHEALRAFDESKRAGNIIPNLMGANPGDSDTVRRSIERNILRRSLIKKKAVKSDISLEERIKQLTCDIDESTEDPGQDSNDESTKSNVLNGEPSAHRDSPTGEENPQQKYPNDKSFSPSSSVSSSSSGSSSAYKKISDIFNRDRKQEKIMEMEENPIVIIPQECRCPAAPDLGMGIQVPVVHTQIHRTPPRQTEPKRQFLSTLAPLTACVAGQKDDLSYYTLAAAEGNSAANTHFAQYNMGDMEPVLCNDEMRKVAPDVIAGTPGQEQDELAAFAQQEANRTEKIKKRYTNDTSNVSSDDDEQNDYGFNKRPSVRGIKPKFSSTNEILQQMQDQLTQQMPPVQNNASVKSYTLPKQASSSSINKQVQNVQPQNPQIPAATAISQQQTERTWSFYGDPEQQRIPIEGSIHPGYYHAMPTVFQQTFQGQEETLMYQNCVTMEQHYGRYARSPTRRPESPPPLRNYHQTMVLIPYNAETYSQFAATSVDPKVAQIQRQNILEYQQVTQQTIRVPISYALPAMQLHVVAGRGHATQHYVQHQQQHIQPQQQTQRILAPRYSMPQDGTMGFSERGVPEGAAAVSHTADCKGIVSPTSQANQPQQQQQQPQQQMPNCNQSTVTSAGPPGSVFYAMNV